MEHGAGKRVDRAFDRGVGSRCLRQKPSAALLLGQKLGQETGPEVKRCHHQWLKLSTWRNRPPYASAAPRRRELPAMPRSMARGGPDRRSFSLAAGNPVDAHLACRVLRAIPRPNRAPVAGCAGLRVGYPAMVAKHLRLWAGSGRKIWTARSGTLRKRDFRILFLATTEGRALPARK